MDRLKLGHDVEVCLSTIVLDSSQWSQREYYLDEVVDQGFKLPQLAKISSVTSGTDLDKKLDLDSSFLIYSRRRRTKVTPLGQLVSYLL